MELPQQIITGKARLAGVAGYPVKHSLSPVLHNFWLQRGRIDGAYVPLEIHPQNFKSVVKGLQNAGFRGLNVTIPHKLSAFELADKKDISAQLTGSVNTLVFSDKGEIFGSSTDGAGFVASLKDEGVDVGPDTRICLLGAGGAARSVAVSLAQTGAQLTITNRNKERGEGLATFLSAHFDHVHFMEWERWEDELSGFDLLVNTTSLGMQGGPLPSYEPSLDKAKPQLVVADCVYTPLMTPLLKEAQSKGCKIVGGLGMLIHQAAFGFEAWFDHKAIIDQQTFDYVRRHLKL